MILQFFFGMGIPEKRLKQQNGHVGCQGLILKAQLTILRLLFNFWLAITGKRIIFLNLIFFMHTNVD